MDQFYTNNNIAQECLIDLQNYINFVDYDVILEPSAGTGSFYKLLPINNRYGLDIEPKYEGIIKNDFLQFIHEKHKKYLIVGNPPFGKISSLAIKFFNYSAIFGDVIAFIIPRTFKRVSVQNRLDLNFHLIFNRDLPINPCCFTPKMNAKCCFQIWIKKNEKRNKIIFDTVHPDFSFVRLGDNDINGQPTPPSNADFTIKAYGSNCGIIQKNELEKLRPKSWHWIKSNINIEELIKRIQTLNFNVSKDTVRQDSIGQAELINLYKLKYN
jgi:hypothetical protein